MTTKGLLNGLQMTNENSDDNAVVSTITTAPTLINVAPPAIAVVTNLPDKLPILPAEIAFIAAWWPAIADVLSANDGNQDANGGDQ